MKAMFMKNKKYTINTNRVRDTRWRESALSALFNEWLYMQRNLTKRARGGSQTMDWSGYCFNNEQSLINRICFVQTLIYQCRNCVVWWLIGRFVAFRPRGRRFEFRSSRHIGTLSKSFTRSCLWHFGVKLRHSIRAVSGVPLSSSGLEEAL